MKIKLVALLVLVAFCFTSCATIFSGSNGEVTILSEPAGADIYINGMRYGSTPLVVDLEKGESYQVELRKEGYENGYARITSSVSAGWVVLDVLGGLVPLVVDAVTGAWENLKPEVVNITL